MSARSVFSTRYRVVRDRYCGFEVQKRLWFFPFWIQSPVNTHFSLESALEFVDVLKNQVVWKD